MADKKKILLVDDSELVAGMVGQILRDSGYDLVRARNGVEGVELAYKEIPDLIIMDVEMPLMQGYQASRLLKNRRGVRDIPIIMHTSLLEDKDKYWALSSGADDFAGKDFDNLDQLLEKVGSLVEHPPYDLFTIREDAANVDKDRVFEMIGTVFDQQLFQSTILNLLASIGRNIDSLSETAHSVLELLQKVCDSHLSVLLLKYQKKTLAFFNPGSSVYQADADEFLSICLGDFYPHFPYLDLSTVERTYFNTENRSDFAKTRLDNRRLSSYVVFELIGKGGTVIGTLHVGNLTNNYFSEKISTNVSIFSLGAGIVLENSLLFNQVSEMQTRIRTVFAKFIPQEIIDDLIEKQGDQERRVGEKRVVTVLFSDIRSFTTISENNSAEAVVAFLNNYFDIMDNVLKKHGGSIDKFIGDAILAIFGAPRSYEDNSSRAVNAALDMIKALSLLKVDKLDLPPEGIAIGVGVNEGVAILGNIGSVDKFDYTVIGDTVNLASRLEGLTKHYNCKIVVSETVKNAIGDEVFAREIDRVRVKGKGEATSIFSVETDPEKFDAAFMDVYGKALKLFKMGHWDAARGYFEKAHDLVPDDHVTELFLSRCRDYSEQEPAQWDGAQVLDFK